VHLTLRPLVDFSSAIRDRELLAVGIGPGGVVASLVGDKSPRDAGNADEQAPLGGLDEHPTFATAVIIWDGVASAFRDVDLEPVRVSHPIVQPLSDGGALVATTRVEVGGDPNALIFDRRGRIRRRIMFGDGIEEVHVDKAGKAWVSYFDEGVYGNSGWGQLDGPAPIGSSGLTCFDLSSGDLEWSFEPPPGGNHIDDCYALNVGDAGVWVYYYAAFDLARIDPHGSISRWAAGWAGAQAIAVDGQTVLLVGAYEAPLAASLFSFAAHDLTDARPVVLESLDGQPPTGRIFARGDRVYSVDGPAWFSASLADIRP
jgi:hypothetical protein